MDGHFANRKGAGMRKLFLILTIFVMSNSFSTGCTAHAANFTSTTYSFVVMEGVVFSNITPANNATGIDTLKPIEFDVKHALTISNVSVTVLCDGVAVTPASVALTPISGGFHVVFTPATAYGTNKTVTWKATATVQGN